MTIEWCKKCGEMYGMYHGLLGPTTGPPKCSCKRFECNVEDWDDEDWEEQWARDEETAAEKYAARMEESGDGVEDGEEIIVNVRTGEALPPSKYHVSASYRLDWSAHRIET